MGTTIEELNDEITEKAIIAGGITDETPGVEADIDTTVAYSVEGLYSAYAPPVLPETADDAAKKVIVDQHKRIIDLERALDDLSEAHRIAQAITNTPIGTGEREWAENILQTRVPPVDVKDQGPMKFTIITGEVDQTAEDFMKKVQGTT